MILEIAHFRIHNDGNAGFEAAFATAQTILANISGYIVHELHRCVEDPCEYRLLVHWDTIEDHMQGFRESPRFSEWRALLQPFLAASPAAAHYESRFANCAAR